jgi:hypothetical protein
MTDRPWTPGPWHYGGQEPDNELVKFGDGCSAKIGGQTWEQARANAELVALAPKMAEAILVWDDSHECDFDNPGCQEGCVCMADAYNALHDVAVKLRQIGGDCDRIGNKPDVADTHADYCMIGATGDCTCVSHVSVDASADSVGERGSLVDNSESSSAHLAESAPPQTGLDLNCDHDGNPIYESPYELVQIIRELRRQNAALRKVVVAAERWNRCTSVGKGSADVISAVRELDRAVDEWRATQ